MQENTWNNKIKKSSCYHQITKINGEFYSGFLFLEVFPPYTNNFFSRVSKNKNLSEFAAFFYKRSGSYQLS